MLLNEERAELAMVQNGLDCLIASSLENVRYTVDYAPFTQRLMRGGQCFAVLPRDRSLSPSLVVPVGDSDVTADQDPRVGSVYAHGTFIVVEGDDAKSDVDERLLDLGVRSKRYPSAAHALAAALGDLGLQRGVLGLDESGLLPGVHDALLECLPEATMRPAYNLFRSIRMVKTPDEVERLRSAVWVTERAFLTCLSELRVGISEQDLKRIFERSVLDDGGYPVITVIGFGRRSAYPNNPASRKLLNPGDVVRFDIGCRYDDYYADIARTVVFGEPSSRVERFYRAMLDGEEAALAAMKPGIRAGELFDIAVAAVRTSGVPHYERHHVGHGIGIEIYDPPILSPGVATPIEEGMVLNVETPYYEIGSFGLQVEDTVRVTRDGFEFLTETGRHLYSV